jgi:hypothetical protein
MTVLLRGLIAGACMFAVVFFLQKLWPTPVWMSIPGLIGVATAGILVGMVVSR